MNNLNAFGLRFLLAAVRGKIGFLCRIVSLPSGWHGFQAAVVVAVVESDRRRRRRCCRCRHSTTTNVNCP
jgi:anti-sigma factor RsiW